MPFLAYVLQRPSNGWQDAQGKLIKPGARKFNYEGHVKGKETQKPGTDFSDKDKSINQLWPGFVAGEWHNNHHLYPNSARSGFNPHQIDLAWYYIKMMSMRGAVNSYKDYKKDFYKHHQNPYLKAKEACLLLRV